MKASHHTILLLPLLIQLLKLASKVHLYIGSQVLDSLQHPFGLGLFLQIFLSKVRRLALVFIRP